MHTTMSSTCHIAVLGAGLIGRRHIQHIIDEPLTTLCAIVEPTPSGTALASKLGIPCFTSVDDLLAARESGEIHLDGAIVGTPTHTHVPLTAKLARAGVHVLVEKPVAPTANEAEALVEALEGMEGKSKVLVGQHRRL
jgi:predicted dehydrogenase